MFQCVLCTVLVVLLVYIYCIRHCEAVKPLCGRVSWLAWPVEHP